MKRFVTARTKVVEFVVHWVGHGTDASAAGEHR